MLGKILKLALVAMSVALATGAQAALEVGPVRLTMVGAERTATLTIRNIDATPVTVQVRTVDWKQVDGKDDYQDSAALLASPTQAQLKPGESQVIRVVVRNVTELPAERTFRLVLDELPDSRVIEGAGVKTQVRVLIPVFLSPTAKGRPNLAWSARSGPGGVVLMARNGGDGFERLMGIKVTAGGKRIDPGNLDGYVLANSSRTWLLPGTISASTISVEAEGELGVVKADVPVAP